MSQFVRTHVTIHWTVLDCLQACPCLLNGPQLSITFSYYINTQQINHGKSVSRTTVSACGVWRKLTHTINQSATLNMWLNLDESWKKCCRAKRAWYVCMNMKQKTEREEREERTYLLPFTDDISFLFKRNKDHCRFYIEYMFKTCKMRHTTWTTVKRRQDKTKVSSLWTKLRGRHLCISVVKDRIQVMLWIYPSRFHTQVYKKKTPTLLVCQCAMKYEKTSDFWREAVCYISFSKLSNLGFPINWWNPSSSGIQKQ